MRKLYNYITIDQKKEVLKELQNSLSQLNDELEKNAHLFLPIVREILLDTKDRWRFEIEWLEEDIKKHIRTEKLE
jgi:hypothetical protein